MLTQLERYLDVRLTHLAAGIFGYFEDMVMTFVLIMCCVRKE